MVAQRRPTIALVSNYGDNSCGFAAYARLRETSFAQYFDVTVFDLRSAALLRPADQSAAGDAHIAAIAAAITDYDVVCIDMEFGIWGDRLDQCEARLRQCCAAARRLVLVVHRVDVDAARSGPFALAQARLFATIAARPADQPYYLLTHAADEAQTLRVVHGFSAVTSHPLCFVTGAQKAALRARSDPAAWKRRLGFDEDAIVLGVFGALSKYKDNLTVIRALAHLPEHYKLVIAGGAHLFSIKPFQTDANVEDHLATIRDIAAEHPGFAERIRFTGVLEDAEFHRVMQEVDYVVVPYHDAGQMASGVGSMAFELGKRMIATHTRLFLSYRALYGDCFETFDIGNYIELRDKIRFFDPEKAREVVARQDRYTAETMAALTHRLYVEMSTEGFVSTHEPARLAALLHALEVAADASGIVPPETMDALLGQLAHARRAYDEAVSVQEQLKAEKHASEQEMLRAQHERARIREEITLLRRNLAAVIALPRRIYRLLRRRVTVPRFNTILDDAARQHFAPTIRMLWLMAPDIMPRKIARANVQQGYMVAAVEALAGEKRQPRMLCVGSFEDTAAIALQSLGYHVDAIDPALNTDLRGYCEQHPDLRGHYDIVFSTSVIEHVPDDETFVADIAALLAPGGYAVLTCDYDDRWRPGQPKPSTDVRLYTRADMTRLLDAMGDVALVDAPDWERDHLDFTITEGEVELRYTFATFVVRRGQAPPA